jgi:hypothetical protein
MDFAADRTYVTWVVVSRGDMKTEFLTTMAAILHDGSRIELRRVNTPPAKLTKNL